MTMTIECRYGIQALAASVTLHGIAVTLALWFVSQINPLPPQETFEWTVSLVEPLHEESVAPSVQAAQSVAPAQTATNDHRQETATSLHQPAQRPTPVHEAHQAERLPDAVAQSVASPDRPVRIETDTPVLHSDVAVSALVAERTESVDAYQVAPPVASTAVQAAEASVESLPVPMAAVPGESGAASVAAEPARPVTMAAQQAPATRPDYGWLVESIGKRMAELKRYPSTARLNGWEGKVVLRAVITADGNLADVKVQKSSGHEALDEAAMESMRQACPLHMRHKLGRAEIVVNIPVLYALAR